MPHDFDTCRGWHPWSGQHRCSWGSTDKWFKSNTQGIVTEMAYVSITNIQMPCADRETLSLSSCASPLSSNWALLFYSPIDGLRPFSCPKQAFSVYPIFHKQLLVFFVIAHYTDFSDKDDKHRRWQEYFWSLIPGSIPVTFIIWIAHVSISQITFHRKVKLK